MTKLVKFRIFESLKGTAKRSVTKDGLEYCLQTNHVGHFLLTNLLLDLLKRTGERTAPRRSRVVVLSSHLYRKARLDFLDDPQIERPGSYSSYLSYANSKLANLLFTRELARRLEDAPVSVYAVHPGVVNTDIFNKAPSYFRYFLFTVGLLFLKVWAKLSLCQCQANYLYLSMIIMPILICYYLI